MFNQSPAILEINVLSAYHTKLHSRNKQDHEEVYRQLALSTVSPFIAHKILTNEFSAGCIKDVKYTGENGYKTLYFHLLEKAGALFSYHEIMIFLLRRYQSNPEFNADSLLFLQKKLSHDYLFKSYLVLDTKYIPLFDACFRKDLVKDNLAPFNFIVTLPVDQDFLAELLKQQYSFSKEMRPEEKALVQTAIFLTNKDQILNQLQKLEKALLKLSSQHSDSEKEIKWSRILSEYFIQWARHRGFKGYACFRTELEPALFFKVMGQGVLFKDRFFADTEHGKWTHYFQWYFLTSYYHDEPFLACPPVNLLSWLGQTGNKNLWDETFEVPSSLYQPQFDARDVLKLNAFLYSQEVQEKFPAIFRAIHPKHVSYKVSLKEACEVRIFNKS